MSTKSPISDHSNDLEDLVMQTEQGGRSPTSHLARFTLVFFAFLWAAFQFWYASPLPFETGILIVNDAEARSIHLSFALILAFLSYPASMASSRQEIPLLDWSFAILAGICASYRFFFSEELALRPGLPTHMDIILSVLGVILLLEATRRCLGPPLMIIGLLFLSYIFMGNAPWLPEVIQYPGASLNKAMNHMWLGDQGVFGIALGVSTQFVFLFVLFGALLEKAGAGSYFIRVAFAFLGHLKGGPAKAAVVASGLTGLISGSSIANVVTTGNFTIPLMRKVGFTAEKAGAVEVASSVNGQLTPPVMGAAAFLMVEYVGIPYIEVIQHAFLPAIISYIALIYIVHLEAEKAGMKGLPQRHVRPWYFGLLITGIIFASIAILAGGAYYFILFLDKVLGNLSFWAIFLILLAIYVGLVYYASFVDEVPLEDAQGEVLELPDPASTLRSGLYYMIPIVILMWCLMVERLSPGLSAFWASLFMMLIIISQDVLKEYFRTKTFFGEYVKFGFFAIFDGFIDGSKNMIGIGVATAAAGIIVGTVTLTGVGLVMAGFVEFLSGGNLILMLLLVALLSLVLGMGLPTTANYIVVSSLMAPVILTVGAENGLIVPLIAVHLFVFYFGIMADVTPPVGLASFAAAALSGGDPIKTGFTAFLYSMRTVALPFIFIFNSDLILYHIEHWWEVLIAVCSATLAMILFAAATQGYFLVRNRLYETILLLLIAFALFRPDFFRNQFYPPYEKIPGFALLEIVEGLKKPSEIRIEVDGYNAEGESLTKTVLLPVVPKKGASAEEILENIGLTLHLTPDDNLKVDAVAYRSPAHRAGLDFDYQIKNVLISTNPPSKYWTFLPALLLLAFIVLMQKLRARSSAG